MDVVTEKPTTKVVPEGYKRTEVGVIPEDWEVKSIGDVANCYSGGTPDTSNSSYYGGDINWITSSDLNRLRIKKVDGKITKEGLEKSSTKIVNEDTLLIALYGATAGVVAMSEIKAAINQAVLAIEPISDNSEYLLQKLSFLKEWIIDKYTQGGQPNLSGKLVKSIKLDLPTLKEQRAIAEALSDVDALIAELDALIEKKQQVKKGAMQQVLTGKKRLPGFDGEWEEKKLGDVLHFQTGNPFSSKYFNENEFGKRLIKNRDLKSDEQVIYYSGPHSQADIVENGDLLVGMDGDFIPCLWDKGTALLNQRVGKINANGEINIKFLFYYIQKPLQNIQHKTSATTVKHLSHNDIEKMELPLPSIEEQKAIAQILSDMDSEIQALQTKRSKYEQIKQGMMQELLTGKTRLG